ncbi:unnamed protein product [Rhizophagus irregularis]|uniref:Uncharacterized protein n=1 Tax=Rhizophagus irregularis TaxID=588596 RepID=A0A916DZ28_9GLOM|nr:unnamed protein product [Rhizophagus irregularis]CAB5312260.1 unnamed protein product [Rhizophagus irregularis]
MIKDKGVVLPALKEGANSKKLIVKADENTRKYLDRYEASRSRMVNDTELDKSALLSVIIVVEDMTKPQDRRDLDKEEEQRRQAKRKTETEMAFKERERRWQHREETMATNREREAERDLDVREKPIRDREIMARKSRSLVVPSTTVQST